MLYEMSNLDEIIIKSQILKREWKVKRVCACKLVRRITFSFFDTRTRLLTFNIKREKKSFPCTILPLRSRIFFPSIIEKWKTYWGEKRTKSLWRRKKVWRDLKWKLIKTIYNTSTFRLFFLLRKLKENVWKTFY